MCIRDSIKLNYPSKITGCNIYGKAEFLNPGGSIKDRAAKAIILDAIKDGKLKNGGTIVEGTAGNTGIGLGLVGNSMGFKTIIVMPETQSQEKKDALNLIGCELKLVPALPYSNPGNYIRQSETLANELNKSERNSVLWANQFDNISNMNGHFNTTGPEIWTQLDGKVEIIANNLRNVPKDFTLLPGMNVSGNVISGTRPLITYLIYPVIKTINTAMREP